MREADLGKTFHSLRCREGLTIEELCHKAGIAPSQLYYLESGKRNIGFATMERVLHALGADLVEILEDAFGLEG